MTQVVVWCPSGNAQHFYNVITCSIFTCSNFTVSLWFTIWSKQSISTKKNLLYHNDFTHWCNVIRFGEACFGQEPPSQRHPCVCHCERAFFSRRVHRAQRCEAIFNIQDNNPLLLFTIQSFVLRLLCRILRSLRWPFNCHCERAVFAKRSNLQYW